MLTREQLKSLKNDLVSYKEELKSRLSGNHVGENSREADMRETFGELSVNDNHPADLGSELFEMEKDLALDNHAESELEKVEAALDAIDSGDYGKCAVCGKEIEYDRLKTVPTSLYCIEHTEEREVSKNRPIEEEVMDTPRGKRLESPQDDDIVDQDTSFQKVARYGTSETPADFNRDGKDYDNLYGGNEENEGFAEEVETFSATDIKRKNRQVMRSQTEREYEEKLEEENTESPLGNIPYRKKDSYIQKDQDKNDRKGGL